MTTTDSRSAKVPPAPNAVAPAGFDSLSGHTWCDAHGSLAAEGQDSPQAKRLAMTMAVSPAGPEQASQGHAPIATQAPLALADDIPGGQTNYETHGWFAAGEQSPPAPVRAATATSSLAPALAVPHD